MATPTLRMLRDALPGSLIGGLVRPGIDRVLSGSGLIDEFHVVQWSGVLGPKLAASKIRPLGYEAALLLTNSFSTALVTRIAGIPRRVGYDRDGRGLLLTERLRPPRTTAGRWAIVPAVEYYLRLGEAMLDLQHATDERRASRPLELGVEHADHRALSAALAGDDAPAGGRWAVLIPGGSKPEKRWPPARFADVGRHLRTGYALRVAVCGGPGEGSIVHEVARRGGPGFVPLAGGPFTIGALKALISRSAIVVSNDTGPRHIAAALGTPCVALFGPTDHRWTVVPCHASGPQRVVVADPTLNERQSANDHPERCRIDRIETGRVIDAVDEVLAAGISG